MKNRKKKYFSLSLLAVLALLTFGGCGKKEKDPASTEVMKITISPEATPTEAPKNVNPDAVITNGQLTMINEYKNGGEKSAGE